MRVFELAIEERMAATHHEAERLIDAVNALRSSHGLASYSINSALMAAAQAHADFMAVTGKASHTGLGGSSVTERLLAAGYPLAGGLGGQCVAAPGVWQQFITLRTGKRQLSAFLSFSPTP